MKVSVVVPAYNEEQYIGKCIESLLKQKEKPDEIIIVNNNSTDHTEEIIKKFPVRILNETKQGMIFARNRGFNEAKFDIIARCDADSILPPGWIKRIKRDFTTKQIDALTGPLEFYDFKVQRFKSLFNMYAKTLHTILHHYPLHGPNMAIKKIVWNQLKDEVCTNDEEVHEDFDISIHIYKNNGVVYFDPLLLAYVSARRMKNDPMSFFVEYPARFYKTIKRHNIDLF